MNQLKPAFGLAFVLSALSLLVCSLLQIQFLRTSSVNSTGIALYLYSLPLQIAMLWLWLHFRRGVNPARAILLASVALVVPATLGFIGIVAVYLHFGGQL